MKKTIDNVTLEEFSITELEDRLEFGLCGGSGDGGDGDDDGCARGDDCYPPNHGE